MVDKTIPDDEVGKLDSEFAFERHSLADRRDLQQRAGIPDLPTNLTYECRSALNGEGPRAYTWQDKPHRLVFDLCRVIEALSASSPVQSTEVQGLIERIGGDLVSRARQLRNRADKIDERATADCDGRPDEYRHLADCYEAIEALSRPDRQ